MVDGRWKVPLTPPLSHRMGEGECFDAWMARLIPGSGPCIGGASLSRRMGEGQGEGYFGNLRKLRNLLWIVLHEFAKTRLLRVALRPLRLCV
jgi:hypothetical protein